jgi:thiamine biosynthesis lipoprotein
MPTRPDEAGALEWPLWSTTARVVTTDPAAVATAAQIVTRQLEAVGLAASRFRAESEVCQVAAAQGQPVRISPLLKALVSAALDAAEATDGDVDPTLGRELAGLGYDRDIAFLSDDPPGPVQLRRRATWRDISLTGDVLRTPPGVLLDLGATTKAWAADQCAQTVADQLGCGALVSLGGDVSTAGEAPAGGWVILVQDGDDQPSSVIALTGARAIATSSTLHRIWQRGGIGMHHILDPVTGLPPARVWRTVSVADETCLAANVLSTAAIVRGEHGIDLLRERAVPARLVRSDGTVCTVNGWPTG